MLTKEELLHKGVPEDQLDTAIAVLEYLEDSDNDDSLSALNKALDGDPSMEDLSKAGKGDEDDKDDDYNEEYMKKYMKRYMKSNKKSCQKMMKDMDETGEKMNKAVDSIDLDADGAIVEMADLRPVLETFPEIIGEMAKAMALVAGQVIEVSDKVDESYDLMRKAAKVTAENAEGMKSFLSKPEGRKSKSAIEPMEKAGSGEAGFKAEDSGVIYSTLVKAMKDKVPHAGEILSVFESRGKDPRKLNDIQKKFISNLIKQEAN